MVEPGEGDRATKRDIIWNFKKGTEKLNVGIRPTPHKKTADVFSEGVEYAVRSADMKFYLQGTWPLTPNQKTRCPELLYWGILFCKYCLYERAKLEIVTLDVEGWQFPLVLFIIMYWMLNMKYILCFKSAFKTIQVKWGVSFHSVYSQFNRFDDYRQNILLVLSHDPQHSASR